MNREPALIALTTAMSYVSQAKTILSRAQHGLDYVEEQLFTRAQAIAEAKAKLAEFGELSGAGLRSLIQEWEDQEQGSLTS